MQVVVAQRWIDNDLALPPDCCFLIVYLPVISIVAVIGDVAAESYKVGASIGNSAHQLLADLRISVLGVGRISESSIAIYYEMEGRSQPAIDRKRSFNRPSLRRRGDYRQNGKQDKQGVLQMFSIHMFSK